MIVPRSRSPKVFSKRFPQHRRLQSKHTVGEERFFMAHSLFDLTGKTAVVVGGTSGIGLAMAIGLAESGADVVATSRRAEQVEEAAKAIESKGRRSLRIPSDVGDRASLEAVLAGTLKEFGKVDIL